MERNSELQEIKQQEFESIQNTIFRAVDFIETFLPDENNFNKIVKLTQPQRDAIDSIQFGFPLSQFDFSEIEKPSRGIVMVWPRQTGKTTGCGYAADGILIMNPNTKIGIIAATEKQAKKLFNKIKKILRHSMFKDMIIQKTMRVDFLELTNGSFVECWPCTEGIEGSTYDYLFVDEAAIMDEKVIFVSALPTVTHGKRWIMLSTPKGPKGKFIDYYFEGLDTRPIICKACGEQLPQAAFNVDRFPIGVMPTEEMHPCPICGGFDYKYGIGKYTVPWVDPWNDGIRSKQLVKALLDENNWSAEARQEYLGEVISDASMVFLGEWLKNCTRNKLTNQLISKGEAYVVGIDYGRKHDASCFYVTHRDKKTGHIVLDFGMTVAGEFDSQRTYRYIRKKLQRILVTFDPIWVVPDATGLGDPLVEELEEDLKMWRSRGMPLKTQIFNNKPNNKGFIISRTTKPELIGNLIKAFAKGLIEIPPASEPEIGKLREELLRYECDNLPGTDYIKYGTQSFHDDRVIALALSVWAHRQRPFYLDQIKIRGFNFNILGSEEI